MNLKKTQTIFATTCLAMSLAMSIAMSAHAQDAITVDPSLAKKHLTHKVEAQYPAGALAAQVDGTVALRLTIDTTGHVANVEVTSGPELLQQAAVDAAKQWVYQPFVVGGKALVAAADVNVVFTLPATAAGTPRAVSTPAPGAVAAPPPETKSAFDSAAGPAEAADAARPPATSKPAFESASPGDAPATPAAAPTNIARAPVAKSGFESAAPPAEAAPAPEAETPAAAPPSGAPPSAAPKSAFESATPPADTPPPAEATPAPAAKPAFDSAAPVEAAPTVIPPAAEASQPTEAAPSYPAAGAAADNFTPLSDQCHKLMAAHGEVDQLVAVCGEMAAAAENLPPDSHYIERRAAYVFDAAALLRAWKYPEAEAMAKRAVAVVEEGHDDVTGASAAYAVLGNAQALNGKLAEADKSLETAETLERQALNSATGQQQTVYSTTLRTILLFHAETLERMGNKSAAGAKRAEAAKLLPVAAS